MRRQSGFTLIEIVIFIIVMGVSLSGIIGLFVQSAVGGNYPFDQQRAIAIANAYMDEIMRKRWDENVPFGGGCVETTSGYCNTYCAGRVYPSCGTCTLDTVNSICVAPTATVPPALSGPEAGENRASFDDIDDYDGVNDTPPQDATGAAVPGYGGYNVQVVVTNTALNGIPALDSKQIVVTVTKGADSYALTAYRVNY